MLRLENIKIHDDLSEDDIVKEACRKYKLDYKEVEKYYIYKKSIDARNKEDIFYNYTIDIKYKGKKEYNNIKIVNKETFDLKINNRRKSTARPVIIGAGPAGLFCALIFVNNGIKPIIIEQGKKVKDRKKDVDKFLNFGNLKLNSNVRFGEGGATTFSDGQLITSINSPLNRIILNEFVKFGAPKQIMYMSKPHIGSDNLINIVANMRKYIINLGGDFLFEEKVIDLELENEKLKAIVHQNNKGQINKIYTDTVVLAIGNSARDTLEKLYEKGLKIERKSFLVGVRIEHKQKMINESQYGNKTKLKLSPAEYKLTYHTEDDRTCYTADMCPGGIVIPSISNKNELIVSGMTKFARKEKNGNSALLVNVKPEDLEGDSPLEGINFQRKLEEKAFILGGKNYHAPIQKLSDFLENKETSKLGSIKPTYKPGVKFANLNEILPDFVTRTLKEGILDFDKKIIGFANPDSILTGIETRISSSIKILRDDDYMSNIEGIYPCGDGSGYVTGSYAAAIDGTKCAIQILEKGEKIK